ncbi:MAG: undecaprenyl-phosphate glucose phosphotransferase [Flavobacteriales bacterium]|nr:undecaprenyl-phosphate glucose phosphotransferase [Flavobacteriales bacterium]
MNERTSRLVWVFLAYDIVIIVASFLGSIYLKYNSFEAGKYFLVLPLIILIWATVVVAFTSQNYHFREGLVQRIRNQVLDFMIFVGIVSTLILVLDLRFYSRLVLFGTILFFFLIRNIGFVFFNWYLVRVRSQGRHVRSVLIIGAGRIGKQVLEYLKSDVGMGYSIVGFLDDNPELSMVDRELVIGNLEDLDGILASGKVQGLILAIPLLEVEKINKAIAVSEFHGLRISMIPDYFRLIDRPFEIKTLGNLPVVNIREITLDNFLNKTLKRLFDLVFALTVCILLFPVFVLIAIMIKLNSKGPVFYSPMRVGLRGEEFKCWKFRSMKVDNSQDHASKSTVENDPRITKLGAFLRKYSLDELPQFYNVLVGEMSVVGPRPHRRHLNEHMQKKVEGYMLRHYIKPGITGWAQVNGWRGPTATAEQKQERTRHDLWYIENWNMWLDVRIILMTVFGNSNKNAF